MTTDLSGITRPGDCTERVTRAEFRHFTRAVGIEQIDLEYTIAGQRVWRVRHVQGADPREMYATRSGVTFHFDPRGSSISAAKESGIWGLLEQFINGDRTVDEDVVRISFYPLVRTGLVDYLRKVVLMRSDTSRSVTTADLRLLRIHIEAIASQVNHLREPVTADKAVDVVGSIVKAEIEPAELSSIEEAAGVR